ncbi:hypothetical protein [Amycolatopsis cihanbeyliensis]|uniref:Uncharacterized protein n=1 Tax=Amycolatopsis cihanbeyliensis TaxID=1128664 RepID=A0A542DQW2_AMYCI|nr:hypothetical protein [Amycolatopsis cihanbeyliensis]TQJ05436.1 hypothetical protein FB471_5266 [Amycolatopsis cihanbeyliensis]
MRLIAAVALAILLGGCGTDETTPSPATPAVSTTTQPTTSRDAADLFLRFLEVQGVTPPLKSTAVRQAELIAEDVCLKIKYDEPMVAAHLLTPLNGHYEYTAQRWIAENAQAVANALADSYCQNS